MTPAAAPDPEFRAARDRVPEPFAIEQMPAPPGAMLLVVKGELDIASAGRLREHVERAVEAKVEALVLDLAEVAFMDSSMLKELLRAQAEIGAGAGSVTLVGVQPPVLRLLELTGTAELFRIAETRAEALRDLA